MRSPNDTQEFVRRMREAGRVERAHCLPHHGSYSVGKHTFDMLLLLDALYPGEPSRELRRAILYHDLAERWTGDLPAPINRRLPKLNAAKIGATEVIERAAGIPRPSLSSEDGEWLKALDCLEFLLWCEDELAMGNKNVEPSLAGQRRWFAENAASVPKEIQSFVLRFHWKKTDEEVPWSTAE